MPVCSNDSCKNVQGKLNKGGLCKQCFRKKIDLYNEPSKPLGETNDQSVFGDVNPQERDIFEIIKDSMANEKKHFDELITILKDEIIYLKKEIEHKNTIINKVLVNRESVYNNDYTTRSAISSSDLNSSYSSSSIGEESNNAFSDNMPNGPITSNVLNFQSITQENVNTQLPADPHTHIVHNPSFHSHHPSENVNINSPAILHPAYTHPVHNLSYHTSHITLLDIVH